MALGADDRKRLHAQATARIAGDPALKARIRERALECVRERVAEGRLPPGLVACKGCGSAHVLTDECVELRRSVEAKRLSSPPNGATLGGLASS